MSTPRSDEFEDAVVQYMHLVAKLMNAQVKLAVRT